MVAIIMVSGLGFALVVERLMVYSRASVPMQVLAGEVRQHISVGRLDLAIAACRRYEAVVSDVYAMAIEQKLGPYEDPDEFVCRRDPDSLVDSAQCANCPLNTNCFAIMEADILDAERKLVDDA